MISMLIPSEMSATSQRKFYDKVIEQDLNPLCTEGLMVMVVVMVMVVMAMVVVMVIDVGDDDGGGDGDDGDDDDDGGVTSPQNTHSLGMNPDHVAHQNAAWCKRWWRVCGRKVPDGVRIGALRAQILLWKNFLVENPGEKLVIGRGE